MFPKDGVKYEFHHLGIPTDETRPNERHSRSYGVFTSDSDCRRVRTQWHRYEPGSRIPHLMQSLPHVAFKVSDLEVAIRDCKVILGPFEPLPRYRVAVIDDGGHPVEFVETELSDEEIWAVAESGESELYQASPEANKLTVVETADLEEIARLEAGIPEFPKKLDLESLQARLAGRPHLCLIALENDRPVAYKVGYQETPNRFYSWIGAVLPEYRGRGIARKLLHRQEQWARAQGYGEINVWSENRYRGMVIFLLKEGYDIFAVSGDGKVLLRKVL